MANILLHCFSFKTTFVLHHQQTFYYKEQVLAMMVIMVYTYTSFHVRLLHQVLAADAVGRLLVRCLIALYNYDGTLSGKAGLRYFFYSSITFTTDHFIGLLSLHAYILQGQSESTLVTFVFGFDINMHLLCPFNNSIKSHP